MTLDALIHALRVYRGECATYVYELAAQELERLRRLDAAQDERTESPGRDTRGEKGR